MSTTPKQLTKASASLKRFLLRLLEDKQFAKKSFRVFFVLILLLVGLIFLKYLFLLLILIAAFVYKFVACRTFFDYTGFDPFMFLSFYVGYAYGPWLGVIFGFLFGLSYTLCQVNPTIRIFWFIPVCTLIGLVASFMTPLPVLVAGSILIFSRAILDITFAITFVGFIPQLFTWHLGHTIFVIVLLKFVIQHLPGIG